MTKRASFTEAEVKRVIKAAPHWAVPPLTMGQAAEALGVGRRTLDEWVKRLPYFEMRGNRRVFYPEHIDAMRRGMNQCACKSSGKTDGHTSTGPLLMEPASDALSKLVMLAARKKRARD